MATGGNLVFQGELDGTFSAYDATTGKRLWHYDTKSPALAPPATYEVGGHQYVTVLTGAGLSGAIFGPAAARLGWDWHTQPRRVLAFRLDANGTLPPRPPHYTAQPVDDPTYKADPALAAEGGKVFHQQCFVCHGAMAEAGGMAPDLRASPVPQSADAFTQIVHGGALMQGGMPRFDQLTDHQLDALRQYIRSRARDLAVGE
jgi:quinohemoprotein ethanol dehydrogenase